MSQLDGSFDFDPFRGKTSGVTQAPPKPVASPVPVAPVQPTEFANHLRRIYSAAGLQNPQMGPPAPTQGDRIRSAASAEAAPVAAPNRTQLRGRLNDIANERWRTLQSLSPNMSPEQRLMLIQHRQGLDREGKFIQGIERADEVRPRLEDGPPTRQMADDLQIGDKAKSDYVRQLQDAANAKERARQLEGLGVYGDTNAAANAADELDTRKAATAAQLRLLNAKAQGAEYDANPELRMLRDSMEFGQKEAAFNQQIKRGDQELERGALQNDQLRFENDPEYRKAIRATQLEQAFAGKDKASAERKIAAQQNRLDVGGAELTALQNDPQINNIVEALNVGKVNTGAGETRLDASQESDIADLTSNIDALDTAIAKYPPNQRADIRRMIKSKLNLHRAEEGTTPGDVNSYAMGVQPVGFITRLLGGAGGEALSPKARIERRIRAAKEINRLLAILK
jgi:hypothetical protein